MRQADDDDAWTLSAALVAMMTGDEGKAGDLREQVKAELALDNNDVSALVAYRRIADGIQNGSIASWEDKPLTDVFVPAYDARDDNTLSRRMVARSAIISMMPAPATPATAAGEGRAAEDVSARLKIERNMTRKEAVKIARTFGVSERGAIQRVWPAARRMAGLPPAKGGRKPSRN